MTLLILLIIAVGFPILMKYFRRWMPKKYVDPRLNNVPNTVGRYEMGFYKAIFYFDKNIAEIKELTVVKSFPYSENNQKSLVDLMQAGRINDLKDMKADEFEPNDSSDLTVVEFLDGGFHCHAALIFDSDELWQDPEVIDMIQLKQ